MRAIVIVTVSVLVVCGDGDGMRVCVHSQKFLDVAVRPPCTHTPLSTSPGPYGGSETEYFAKPNAHMMNHTTQPAHTVQRNTANVTSHLANCKPQLTIARIKDALVGR